MVCVGFRGLIVVLMVLGGIFGVYGENPTLIWEQFVEGGQVVGKDPGSQINKKLGTKKCEIQGIVISRNGKLYSYRTSGELNCDKLDYINEKGEKIKIEDNGSILLGITWDKDELVTSKIQSDKSLNISFFNQNGASIKTFILKSEYISPQVYISKSGEFISIIDGNQIFKIYDSDGKLLSSKKFNTINIESSASISNSGKLAIFIPKENKLLFYNSNGDLIFEESIKYSRGFVEVSSDGKRIALGINDPFLNFEGLVLFDFEGNKLLEYQTHEQNAYNSGIVDIEIANDGDYIYFIAYYKNVEIFKEKSEKIGDFKLRKTIKSISVSERGGYIIASDGFISNDNLFDINDGNRIYKLDNSANTKNKTIVILANSIDYELNSDLFGFLGNNGMNVVRATADDFDQYKNEKFVVILGGPDAPEGVGGIVREILMNSEQDQIRENENRKMYVKTNVWSQGQRVSVIAGSDRGETQKASGENKEIVAEE